MDIFHQQLARIPARVRRDEVIETIPASELAPGQIVVLAAGDIVPADCRLLSCTRLRVRESVLTGESVPVEKTGDPRCLDELPIWEQHNMAFYGTWVTDGSGLGLVTATGERTAYGRIVALTQAVRGGSHRPQRPHADTTQMVMVFLMILLGIFVLLGFLQLALLGSALLTAGAMSLHYLVLPAALRWLQSEVDVSRSSRIASNCEGVKARARLATWPQGSVKDAAVESS